MSITNSATTGYEAELWEMADALRGTMDAAEYKHIVLGLIFLKYVSDAFEETHARLEAERDEGADPEHRDEYLARNVLWVPREARWANLAAQARLPTIGQTVDDAMDAIEEENPALDGVLPKNYALPALDKQRLGHMVDRTHREFSDDDIARIADTHHAWRSVDASNAYGDVPGFCKSADLDEVRRHNHVLTPGRYVGAESAPDDGEPFDLKMTRLASEWREQQAEAALLDAAIEENLEMPGFGAASTDST